MQPWAAEKPPPQQAVPPSGANDRPTRERRKPAWMLARDFDMEASASTVRYHGVDESDANNSVEGVSGYDKDDQDPSNTRHHRDLVALVSAFQKVLSAIAQSV